MLVLSALGGYNDGKKCLRMLELTFGGTLKMHVVPGLVLECKDIFEGNVSSCYQLGKKIAQELDKATSAHS